LLESCIRQIQSHNSELNTFITVLFEQALNEAENAERRIKKGVWLGPLDGIPFSVKDMIQIKGVKCTAGSILFKNYIAKRNAICISKLKKAGAIVIGTTNLNEFASGITGINPHYGSSKNPWNKDHISGGSSSGSCVSVSTGMVSFSLGTDTGGSIRVPSAFCGTVGLKPTYDLVSRDGVINLAPSLDHVGCITRSICDAAIVLEALIAKAPSTRKNKAANLLDYISHKIVSRKDKLVVGIPDDYFFENIDLELIKHFDYFIKTIESAVSNIKFVSIKGTNRIPSTWTIIRLAEAAEQHKRWIMTKSAEYSIEVRNMIKKGLEISAVDYIHAYKLKHQLTNNFLVALKTTDVLVLPSTSITAPKFKSFMNDDENSSIRNSLLRNSIPSNISGLPAVNVPVGLDRFGIPVGVQIVGRPFEEAVILSLGYEFEQKGNFMTRFIPPV
jgi:aspartyl-tRNA(Asn)/glutamyl-tRNA(Gln) amidotransferase subunit A